MKSVTTIFIFLLSLSFLSAQTDNFNISGNILCDNGGLFEGVQVLLLDESSNVIDSTISNQNGDFQFTNVQGGLNYYVQASNTSNPLNGLSTFDMVLIAKHILNVNELSPEKVLAADLNQSNTVTTLDMIFLRYLILGLETPNSFQQPEWIFYREVNNQMVLGAVHITTLSSNIQINLNAIKRGDVNGSAVCRP